MVPFQKLYTIHINTYTKEFCEIKHYNKVILKKQHDNFRDSEIIVKL